MPLPSATPWSVLLPAALAGPRRHPFAPLPGLTPALGGEADGAEKQLLLTAANLALVQQAGQRPLAGPAGALPPAPPDTWPLLGPAGSRLVEQVLAGHDHRAFAYCLAALDAHGRRLPPRLLRPALALLQRRAYAEGYDPLREPYSWLLSLHARVFGVRGLWLAELLQAEHGQLNGALSAAKGAFAALAHGPTDRYFYWLELLVRRPLLGRQRLAQDLPAEPAEMQQGLLWYAWAANRALYLPPPYQAQLTELLTQQAPPDWVRHYQSPESKVWAPGNAAPERLWARTQQWLTYLPAPTGPGQLRVKLPAAYEPEWDHDGVYERPQVEQRGYPGRAAESWLGQHLALLPPSRWAARWHLTMPEVVAVAGASDRADLLLAAWLRAAVTTRDLPAARALLDYLAGRRAHAWFAWLVPPVVRLLPPDEQRAWLRRLPPAKPTQQVSLHWVSWLDALYPELPGLLPELLPTLRATLAHGASQPNDPYLHGNGRARDVLTLLERLPYRGEDNLRPAVQAELGSLPASYPVLAAPLATLLAALTWREEFVATLPPAPT